MPPGLGLEGVVYSLMVKYFVVNICLYHKYFILIAFANSINSLHAWL